MNVGTYTKHWRWVAAVGVGCLVAAMVVMIANAQRSSLNPDLTSRSPAPTTSSVVSGQEGFAGLVTSSLDPAKIEIFASDIPGAHGLAVFDGVLFASSWQADAVYAITVATRERRQLAGDLGGAHDMIVDADGQLVVPLFKQNRVVQINRQTGQVVERARGLAGPNGIASATNGSIYVSNALGGSVVRFDQGQATPVTVATGLREPAGLALTAEGAVLVAQFADATNAVIRLQPDGQRSTLVSGLTQAETVLIDGKGRLLIGHVVDGKAAISLHTPEQGTRRVLKTNLPGPMVGPVSDGSYLYFESAGDKTVYRIPLPR